MKDPRRIGVELAAAAGGVNNTGMVVALRLSLSVFSLARIVALLAFLCAALPVAPGGSLRAEQTTSDDAADAETDTDESRPARAVRHAPPVGYTLLPRPLTPTDRVRTNVPPLAPSAAARGTLRLRC